MPLELSLPLKVPPTGVIPFPPVGTRPPFGLVGLAVAGVSVLPLELSLPVEPELALLLALPLVSEPLELVSPRPVDDGSEELGDAPERGE